MCASIVRRTAGLRRRHNEGQHARVLMLEELADSLFAELYGLVDGKGGERSLFRYFHGRSALKTWLRAILAQRHVDRLRESRRWESFDQDDGEEPRQLSGMPCSSSFARPAS